MPVQEVVQVRILALEVPPVDPERQVQKNSIREAAVLGMRISRVLVLVRVHAHSQDRTQGRLVHPVLFLILFLMGKEINIIAQNSLLGREAWRRSPIPELMAICMYL